MKKVFVLVVAAILVFSTLQIIAQDGVSFKDLDSVPWAEDAVLGLVSLGIIKGTSSDTFEPHRVISRAEFITMVNRAFKIRASVLAMGIFKDCPDGEWFSGEIVGAYRDGLIDEYLIEDGYIYPQSPVTREEIASIAVRALRRVNYLPPGADLEFSDYEDIAPWARGYVEICVKLGLLLGTGDNTFSPKAKATRAQAAVLVKRMMDINKSLERKKLPDTEYIEHEVADIPFENLRPAHIGSEYKLVFYDDFEGDTLDASKWNYGYPWGNGKTHNHRAYCVPENVIVKDGLLTIVGENKKHPESRGATAKFDGKTLSVDFTSGAINTNGKYHFNYGYIEARLKVAGGKGMWPAFWMLGNGWPPEIDIMEYLGSKPTQYVTNVHFKKADGSGNGSHYNTPDAGVDLSEDFHVYAIEWTPNYMKWYLDGKQVGTTFTNKQMIATQKNMYIILNLAIGGWDGDPDETTKWPAYYQCDWVRVWQRDTY